MARDDLGRWVTGSSGNVGLRCFWTACGRCRMQRPPRELAEFTRLLAN